MHRSDGIAYLGKEKRESANGEEDPDAPVLDKGADYAKYTNNDCNNGEDGAVKTAAKEAEDADDHEDDAENDENNTT